MEPDKPHRALNLVATSVAEDLGFLALSDLAHVFAEAGGQARLIGGHMVTLHAQRWSMGQKLYRETQDADLGVARLLVTRGRPVELLSTKGYQQVAGNRFAKGGTDESHQALIDVLVPALKSRARSNVKVGDLATTEVPGLAEALRVNPVWVELTMHRLNGDELRATIALPDEPSALVLKALAWERRSAGKDAVDIWRCLEIATAAGVTPEALVNDAARSAKSIVQDAFAELSGDAMRAIIAEHGLSEAAGKSRHTRIRAMAAAVFGP